jgi:hypothetical protein
VRDVSFGEWWVVITVLVGVSGVGRGAILVRKLHVGVEMDGREFFTGWYFCLTWCLFADYSGIGGRSWVEMSLRLSWEAQRLIDGAWKESWIICRRLGLTPE